MTNTYSLTKTASGDKLSSIEKNLREIKQKFDELKASGMDVEILEAYLKHKTGFSMMKVRKMLANIDEFFTKLCKKEILASYQEDNKDKRINLMISRLNLAAK